MPLCVRAARPQAFCLSDLEVFYGGTMVLEDWSYRDWGAPGIKPHIIATCSRIIRLMMIVNIFWG